MKIKWWDVDVYDEEENFFGKLGGIVRDAPANLDEAVIEKGKIVDWPGFSLGHSPDVVDWRGFPIDDTND
jgi:hypothetical protein